ncbi:hypothetical protein MRB53_023862 [Persea americana]|uniref:Uncharacterized protein n=1 Tax=Persea americana TaxID=3435 RepID=A0ACC2LBX3_PERAE|nr:hypothetical protein MRB53_023862 [Persea americana]
MLTVDACSSTWCSSTSRKIALLPLLLLLSKSIAPAFTPTQISSRASSVTKSDGFPYYIGLQKHKADPYHASDNLDDIIQLGLVEN